MTRKSGSARQSAQLDRSVSGEKHTVQSYLGLES
ncbi:hypothetical protein COLO4_35002 [Corchorus olitorius]|uniref:Uncharacterized protein n=1 Tax=Corchorus olitorius TaxID=93759 RepID=A0A1R3GIM2_9ROSI|nr:hypothetical protein COLO4_35002 [Corchorus olitorius]